MKLQMNVVAELENLTERFNKFIFKSFNVNLNEISAFKKSMIKPEKADVVIDEIN